MNLPNSDKVQISEEKLRQYLLSSDHAVGRFKARFLARLGFTADNSDELRARLRDLAKQDGELGPATSYGQKYLVFGQLEGPLGAADVVTVWIVLAGDDTARLVTVYPR